MHLSAVLRTGLLIADVLIAPLLFSAQTPDPQPKEMLGLPARTAPSEYLSQGKAGNVTIGAEFMEHSVPTPQATYSTDDYVIVEVGLFGTPESRLKLSLTDFSLRINGKKTALASEHYEIVFKSLRDLEWEPPADKSKSGGLSTNGGGGGGGGAPGAPPMDSPPVTPKMPIELRRVMEQRVQRASMLEGERALPQAGLLFFEFHGKAKNIRSMELLYDGPAGKTTIPLQP
jgi:hypothetical protein